ncbi:oxidoreductase [Arsenicibacter rosenii]|uniref:Oxidoreductase n=1 Tax=Arsenicibacter rosenii TaxID=1750698 RepID=A0A1S2VGU2_9BACT|nr:oxidoreductase [Arsenicibacter rosenii]
MNIALIGYGKVSHLHAKAAQQVGTLVAVYGRDATKAAAFAQQYNIRPYTNVADMVATEQVDVCIVCTPHPAHREPAVAALEAGANVLVEKPLASTLADCDAMINAAKKAGRWLGTISQRRFYRSSQRVREAIDAGKIGNPSLGMVNLLGWRDEAYYRSDPWRGSWAGEGGGVLVNQAPHQLDLLLWYMGEPEELFGIWKNINHPYIEVDDTAVAIVKFKNGGIGNIVVSNSQKPGIYGKVHIHGQNGASIGVQTDGGSMFVAGMTTIQEPPANDLWTVPGEEHLLAGWVAEEAAHFETIDVMSHFFAEQLRDFCAAVRDNRPPLVTGEDGRRVVALFQAIYESTRMGGVVRFADL